MSIVVNKTYRYRVYPNKIQKELINKTFGCVRFVYNYYLNKSQNDYKENHISFKFNNYRNDLPKLKQEYEWLQEVDSQALQVSIKYLDRAYKQYFKKKIKHIKYKTKKSHRYSYTTTASYISIINRKIKLPKLGLLKTRNKFIPKGRILHATVVQEATGHYYVSLYCEEDIQPLQATNKNVGIDLGIKDYCITSSGDKYKNPHFLIKSQKKLKRRQRQLSRKTRGSNNYEKARIKFAKLHNHIGNKRRAMIQKLTTKLVRKYDNICFEDLDVKRMLKNHNYSLNISDAAWSEFRRELEYKSQWYGRKTTHVDTFYPSSQICSCCGYKNTTLKDTSIREWTCPQCHTHHDRDINAAKNIEVEGISLLY